MIYGDNPLVTQRDYDTYYTERYGYGVTDDECKLRLIARAEYISRVYTDSARVVDFGGGDGVLPDCLRDLGFADVWNYGIGDDMPQNCDAIVAEHVLEHIYDLDTAMRIITGALKDNGMLLVDVPDAGRIAIERNIKTPILDFSQVHINHFRLVDMLNLMKKWGFELVETKSYHERGSACRQYVFIKDGNLVSGASKWFVAKNISERIQELRALGNKPVCVWGFGDIASECLAGWFPNVKYFVCNDPAFEGTTIRGLPVYKSPIDNLPIVVIAQSQKEILLEKIRGLGLDNQVIVI